MQQSNLKTPQKRTKKMITLIFITLTIFISLIALESSLNAFSRAMSLINLLVFGEDDTKSFEDLTTWKSETKIQAEKATMVKYGKIIAQKIFEESERAIEYSLYLIQQVNTHTNRITLEELKQIECKANKEHQQRQEEQDKKEFEYIEKYFNSLRVERQELQTLEYI